ncbi:MAG TPA: hypothetical protein VEZ90_00390 [Blastocatellia bacterium]|nr:hypothetical protein [Blastocatellia bacterium]
MTKKFVLLALVLTTLLGLFACSSDTPKDSAPPASSPASTGSGTKAAGNTSSANTSPWGGFKVGSFVQTKTTTSMEVAGKSMDTVVEGKMTLADLTSDKAVVDIESTVMGHTTKTRQEFPLTGGVTPTGTGATSGVEPKTGTDTLTIAGKSISCKTIEVDTEQAGNKVNSKTWTSDQVPGFMVKSVATTSGATNSKVTVEVTDFKAN